MKINIIPITSVTIIRIPGKLTTNINVLRKAKAHNLMSHVSVDGIYQEEAAGRMLPTTEKIAV